MTPDRRWPLQRWLDYQLGLHPQAIALGLERIDPVRRRLGLGRLAPLQLTVGGTNGKGSVCALLAATLRAAGLSVGVYTSPHLLHYRERIELPEGYVDDERLCAAFASVESARGETPLTFFEFGTLAAAWIFQAARLDAVILEVGLGGRLDAVNLFDPDGAVLTSVDLDHCEYLGPTREAIGAEKAHIFRAGRPAVCGDPRPVASVRRHAQTIGAHFWQAGVDYHYLDLGADWCWSGGGRRLSLPRPAMPGDWQLQNAAAAIALLEALAGHWPGDPAHYASGLRQLRVPGRLQRIATAPEILLDVAHNPHAVRALRSWLERAPERPTHVVFGALRDKDVAAMVDALAPLPTAWYLVGLEHASARGLGVGELRTRLEPLDRLEAPVHAYARPVEGYAAARRAARADERILVFGSFHLLEAVLRSEGYRSLRDAPAQAVESSR